MHDQLIEKAPGIYKPSSAILGCVPVYIRHMKINIWELHNSYVAEIFMHKGESFNPYAMPLTWSKIFFYAS